MGTIISQNVDILRERSHHQISFTHSISCGKSFILSKTVDDK